MIQLLKPKEAAKRLDICERTLRRLRQAGEIHFIAVTPRTIRYTPEDCDDYLARQRRKEEPVPSAKPRVHISGRPGSSPPIEGFMARREARRNALRKGSGHK